MKNNIFFSFFLVLAFVGIYSNCAENSNRVYFTINPENRQIIIPVQLNDSITANMLFDSGASDDLFLLDSSFVASYSCLVPNTAPTIGQKGIAWTDKAVLNSKYQNILQTVKIGNASIIYNTKDIANWREMLQNKNIDGMFNIPTSDTTHVWEWNFEHNYLEIHSIEDFQMPQKSFLCPIVKESERNPFFIQIPMQIRFADGDTLTNNRIYLVDLGMINDISIMYPAEELTFLDKKEDVVWNSHLDWYSRRYTVSATILDDFVIDSLRIYTYDKPFHLPCKYLIGQHFLRRFNVFFDMKNRQIGLQPINFKRIINPKVRRFYYQTRPNSKGKDIITVMANYKKNFFKASGLNEGDEIVAMNDSLYKNLTYHKYYEIFDASDTLVFDIIRNEQMLKIVVPIDKNEEQGD
jgi:hypothetical protein